MRRRFLLAPAFMVALTSLCLTQTDCGSPTPQEPEGGSAGSKQAQTTPGDLTFRATSFGTAVDERLFSAPHQASDVMIDTTLYEASDGVKVQRSIYDFRTPAQARRKLRKSVAEAETVVEHNKRDPRTGRTEERAVLLRKATDPSWKAAVLWTNGADLYALGSSSLKHALLLEKRLKPQAAAGAPR